MFKKYLTEHSAEDIQFARWLKNLRDGHFSIPFWARWLDNYNNISFKLAGFFTTNWYYIDGSFTGRPYLLEYNKKVINYICEPNTPTYATTRHENLWYILPKHEIKMHIISKIPIPHNVSDTKKKNRYIGFIKQYAEKHSQIPEEIEKIMKESYEHNK